MAKLSTQEIIDAIKELTVLELNDLVKACEEEFGVSAAAGVVVAGNVGGAGGGAASGKQLSCAGYQIRDARRCQAQDRTGLCRGWTGTG